MKPVKHMKITNNMKTNDLVKEMSKSGVFGAGKIAKATDIFEEMIRDKNCKVFLGLAGALVPAGLKDIIIDLIENKYIDVLVTTGANLTHDLIEAVGYKHFQGNSYADDVKLNKKRIDRIYDIFMEDKVYQGLEDFFNKNFNEISKTKNIREFLFILGKLTKKKSILNSCYKKNIPIFCPAISDSGIGLMIWNNLVKNRKINIDAFDDLKDILDINWTSKKSGFIYLGGGVPKNYIQQALQFSKSASYGIQITMDRVETGGSSGAELKEGISWGKLNKKAKFVDLRCDVSIALPLIYSALKDRLR